MLLRASDYLTCLLSQFVHQHGAHSSHCATLLACSVVVCLCSSVLCFGGRQRHGQQCTQQPQAAAEPYCRPRSSSRGPTYCRWLRPCPQLCTQRAGEYLPVVVCISPCIGGRGVPQNLHMVPQGPGGSCRNRQLTCPLKAAGSCDCDGAADVAAHVVENLSTSTPTKEAMPEGARVESTVPSSKSTLAPSMLASCRSKCRATQQ